MASQFNTLVRQTAVFNQRKPFRLSGFNRCTRNGKRVFKRSVLHCRWAYAAVLFAVNYCRYQRRQYKNTASRKRKNYRISYAIKVQVRQLTAPAYVYTALRYGRLSASFCFYKGVLYAAHSRFVFYSHFPANRFCIYRID